MAFCSPVQKAGTQARCYVPADRDIRERACMPPHGGDVLTHAPVGRRTLERRFRKLLSPPPMPTKSGELLGSDLARWSLRNIDAYQIAGFVEQSLTVGAKTRDSQSLALLLVPLGQAVDDLQSRMAVDT